MRVVSGGELPRPATGDDLGVQHQQCPSTLGWAYRSPVDARSHPRPCFPLPVRCWAQPSGLLRHAGGSFIYFMAQAPIARSLGRQWPPIELAMQGAALRGAESSASEIARVPPSVVRLHKALLIAPAQDKVATLLSRQRAERSPMRPGAGEYQVIGQLSSG